MPFLHKVLHKGYKCLQLIIIEVVTMLVLKLIPKATALIDEEWKKYCEMSYRENISDSCLIENNLTVHAIWNKNLDHILA